MNWTLWWIYFTTMWVLCLTPGPAVLLVISSSLRNGPRPALASAGGILTANAFYFVLSATSIGSLLLSSYRVFFLMKWVGAAYLVFLGIRTILSRPTSIIPECDGQRKSSAGLYRAGVVLQLSNPKAILFFSAILPQFIDVSLPPGFQIAVFGTTDIIVEFLCLTAYAFVAGRASEWLRQPRYAALTNRVSGTLLVTAGGGLALMRRD